MDLLLLINNNLFFFSVEEVSCDESRRISKNANRLTLLSTAAGALRARPPPRAFSQSTVQRRARGGRRRARTRREKNERTKRKPKGKSSNNDQCTQCQTNKNNQTTNIPTLPPFTPSRRRQKVLIHHGMDATSLLSGCNHLRHDNNIITHRICISHFAIKDNII
jgi:hypothetical protein